MFSDSPPIIKNECHTTIAVLCTIFICLGVFLLIFMLFYLACFKPLYDAHKYCVKQQQRNETKQQISATTLLEQYDDKNKFAYPKYIYNMQQVLPEERCKQGYIKHREYRRHRKKNRPISLSTINENYATDFFPRSTVIDDKWITKKEMCSENGGSRSTCKCRSCVLGKIMNTTSTIRPSLFSEHRKCHSTPV
ncbi:hypothetical protein ACH3XW_2300 [Acanthocheilonema viteae]